MKLSDESSYLSDFVSTFNAFRDITKFIEIRIKKNNRNIILYAMLLVAISLVTRFVYYLAIYNNKMPIISFGIKPLSLASLSISNITNQYVQILAISGLITAYYIISIAIIIFSYFIMLRIFHIKSSLRTANLLVLMSSTSYIILAPLKYINILSGIYSLILLTLTMKIYFNKNIMKAMLLLSIVGMIYEIIIHAPNLFI
jgi:hypothetical protein